MRGARAAITGGALDPGVVTDPTDDDEVAAAEAARSSVALRRRGSNESDGSVCSGTLIFPNVVLTAAHCIGQNIDPGIRIHPNLPDVVTGTNDCFVHPNSRRLDVISNCAEAPAVAGETNVQFDLALLRLNSPMEAIHPRSIAPPRSAFVEASPDPVVIRGFSGARLVTRRKKITLPGYIGIDPVTFGNSELLRIVATTAEHIDRGDSGGGLTEAEYDLSGGPVLGVVSRISDDAITSSPLLWRRHRDDDDPSFVLPIDWLWGALDPDGNCGLGAPPGNCRVFGEGPVLPDRDGDGLPDMRDLCPDVVPAETCGSNHCDADGDWVGDECDVCAFGSDHADADGDEVPDACDNCTGPEGANATQANCNLDAEAVTMDDDGLLIYDPSNGKFGVGDACDPVPCGETRFSVTSIRLDDLRIHALSGIDVEGVRGGPTSEENLNGFRHCRCPALESGDTLRTRLACEAVFGCSIADSREYRALRTDPSLEDRDREWRLFTVLHPRGLTTTGSESITREVVLPHERPDDGVFSPDTESTWDRFADQRRWETLGFGDSPPFGETPGVFWTHTPESASGVENDPELAHHYTSLVVPEERTLDTGLYRSVLRAIGPRIELSPDRALLPPGFSRDAFPGSFFGAGSSGEPILVELDAAEPADEHFAGSAMELFRLYPDARWIPAAEPTSWLPEGGPRYALLAPDGSQLLATLEATAKGFALPAQDPWPPLTDSPRVLRSATEDGSPVVATLSAREQRLWLATVQEGLQLSEVDLRTGQRSVVPVFGTAAISDVLAITYSPFHDALWLLASGEGDVDLFRITVVASSTGRAAHAERFFTYSQPGSHRATVGRREPAPRAAVRTRRYAIAASSVGELFVVSSGEEDPRAHCALSFAPEGRGLAAPRRLMAPGRMAVSAVRVSERGLSVAVETHDAALEPVGHRRDAFRAHQSLAPCFD